MLLYTFLDQCANTFMDVIDIVLFHRFGLFCPNDLDHQVITAAFLKRCVFASSPSTSGKKKAEAAKKPHHRYVSFGSSMASRAR